VTGGPVLLVLRSFSAPGHGQCFAAFLTFLPLCLTLPAPFFVLLLAAFASRFAFLATPITGSSSSPDMSRSGACHLPRWMQLKPGGGRDLCRRENRGDLATKITPMRRAISPEAPSKMRPGDTRMLSPKTTMPRTNAATGSAAVMPGRKVCGGATLKGALHEPQPDRGDSYGRVSGSSWSAAAQSQR